MIMIMEENTTFLKIAATSYEHSRISEKTPGAKPLAVKP